MSILERRREIGVLKALGASDRSIRQLFFAEAGVMGLVGGVAGVALGWGIGRAIQFVTTNLLPPAIDSRRKTSGRCRGGWSRARSDFRCWSVWSPECIRHRERRTSTRSKRCATNELSRDGRLLKHSRVAIKQAGRSAEGSERPCLPCPPPQLASKLGLRGVFVAAQKFVSLDFGHDARKPSRLSSSLRCTRPRQRTRTGPARVISWGSVRTISTGEPFLTFLWQEKVDAARANVLRFGVRFANGRSAGPADRHRQFDSEALGGATLRISQVFLQHRSVLFAHTNLVAGYAGRLDALEWIALGSISSGTRRVSTDCTSKCAGRSTAGRLRGQSAALILIAEARR